MGKHIKFLSVLLAGAMLLSFCSCSRKHKGPGVIETDLPYKPERPYGETVIPVPTETDPTDPTETDPAPTTTATTPTVNNGGAYEMSVKDIMLISQLCIGMPVEEATEFIAAVYGITSYTASDSNYGDYGDPMERFLRDLNVDLVVEGVTFKSIGIHSTTDGYVGSVDYTMRKTAIFASNEAFDSKGAYDTLYPEFVKAFGDPSDDYSASWVDFDESGMNGWRYGDDGWVSIFWGVSCQGVKGNDQLVIAYEVDNPYNYVTSDPGSSGTVPTATRGGDYDSEISQVYDMMDGTMGLDKGMAQSAIQGYFGINLGKPEERDGEYDGYKTYSYYDAVVTICGIDFNVIEISTNSWGAVYHISFINNMESGDTIHEYVLAMTDEVNSIFGDPTMDYPLTDENSTIEFYDHDLDPNIVVSVGGYYSGSYNSLWFSLDDYDLG